MRLICITLARLLKILLELWEILLMKSVERVKRRQGGGRIIGRDRQVSFAAQGFNRKNTS